MCATCPRTIDPCWTSPLLPSRNVSPSRRRLPEHRSAPSTTCRWKSCQRHGRSIAARLLARLQRGLRAFSGRSPASLRVLDVAHRHRPYPAPAAAPSLPGRQLGAWISPRLPARGEPLPVPAARMNCPTWCSGQCRGPLPFADGQAFQAVSCIFLLHELPGEARQNDRRMFPRARTRRHPGLGRFVGRWPDSPDFMPAMEKLPADCSTSPYYRDYIGDRTRGGSRAGRLRGHSRPKTHFIDPGLEERAKGRPPDRPAARNFRRRAGHQAAACAARPNAGLSRRACPSRKPLAEAA